MTNKNDINCYDKSRKVGEMMAICQKNRNQLIIKGSGETIIIEPWGADSFRVRGSMMSEIIDNTFSLLPQTELTAEIQISKDGASIVNGKIKCIVSIENWQDRSTLSFYDDNNQLLLKERSPQGALNLKGRLYEPILGGAHSLTMTFDADEDEKLYGMGQYQQNYLDVKNCQFELAHRNSQASIPFVLSSKGYGFLWHNPAIGYAHFNKNSTQWYAKSTQQLDYWITASHNPADIVKSYASVTGTVPMMPEYGLGFWQCKLRYYHQEQLLSVAREYKKRDIPIDVIVCDFFHWPRMGDFRFDEEFFPDPKAMTSELKEMGIELMVSVWPQIDHRSENYQKMKDHNYLVKSEYGLEIDMLFGGNSVFFDSTNPGARDYVWQKCKQNYYDHGIKVFWLDEAEPEYGSYDFINYRYHLGPNVQVGNLYPQLFSKTFYDGLKECEETDIVNLVRCAWSGSQRYGALVWSGDIHSTFDDLKNQIHAGLHMGIVGIPWWTTDIGGFHGGNANDPKFIELLIRWFEYGTFCPVMRLHGDRQPTTHLLNKKNESALFTGSDNEIWSFGDEAYNIFKSYIAFREAMRPYIRGLMQEAHENGLPVMRPMFLEFAEEAEAWNCPYQYMFGPDLLVAPIIELGATSRQVYLPESANWVNLHTGEKLISGGYHEIKAPLHQIPLFIKEGTHDDWIGIISIPHIETS